MRQLPMPAAKSSSTRPRRPVAPEPDSLDLLDIFRRQRWMIIFLAVLGLAAGILYALNATVWFESRAKLLISERTAGLGGTGTGTGMVEEDTLANHIELISSRMIVDEALKTNGLTEIESLQSQVSPETDAAEYVIEHLEIVKGGSGGAKTARTLNISFSHPDPEDARLILTAVMKQYEKFIVAQVEQVMGRANELVQKAKSDVEESLATAEQEQLKARQEAPLFFQGEGSSNVYQDRFRRLQDEMLDLDIQESTLRTRLDRVQAVLAELEESNDPVDNLDKLSLIDSESLERLGLFTGLQMNSSNTAEFKAAMPAKIEEARTQFTHLLQLNSEKQRLNAVFGPGHPKVQEIEGEIELVKQFLQDNEELTNPDGLMADTMLTPEGLLNAYTGFLQNDLAALAERRKELGFLTADAEKKAKELIEYELRDLVLQKNIERQEALFDGIVTQLRELDTASSLSGYLYEFLEVPRVGEPVWPKLPLCAVGGLALGLCGGLALAFGTDVRDRRFRSAAELDEMIGLPNLGRVGKMMSINQGVNGLISAELSPDAEAFRLGRTMMLMDIKAGKLKTIGFTSPLQGDGKSTIMSNFAVSFAQVNLKVLVIDADLRRPTVHRYFSVENELGLSDLLENETSIEETIRSTAIDNVSVMTAGSSTKTPAELLQTSRLDEILDELKQEFDVILLDLPPVLAVSDPVVVLPRIDGSVLVIRVSRARRDEVLNTMRRIRESGGNFVGWMLNSLGAGTKFDSAGGYSGYYESDYTRKSSRNGKAVNGRAKAGRQLSARKTDS
ncbi:polysaccharide biosynthesis tyrosine autokinase [Roseiconus nitratireducens]|uniref:non-specific protein-tyrosine kinase n=1 Tax=Roseiconus nitratireducens TaxID=2605748 RepID=A0A5M6CY44_9BACT|nr:polysaccharide biosynthesis tyrosine autokinase [Roseiconus nitratireducens]KAA5540023.1 polysaccharide biosynthesis tyrosine autokinase [Roseiconus nitratireducens]